MADDAISKLEKKKVNKADKVNKLVEWKPDEGDSDSEKYKLDGTDGWDVKDMYARNEQLGWTSTYDPASKEYTNAEVGKQNETDVDRQARLKRAEDKAKTIEGSKAYQKKYRVRAGRNYGRRGKIQFGATGHRADQTRGPKKQRQA